MKPIDVARANWLVLPAYMSPEQARGEGHRVDKLLLVIDQFEQWLYSESDYAKAALTSALRQCDGLTVQAIVMVRDDFWLSVSRFLREIGVRLLEGETSALVDLFEIDHAEKVLGLFGVASGWP